MVSAESLATATNNQQAAYHKGYKAAQDGHMPSMGGLYLGEEVWYLKGYNQRRAEENRSLFRMPRSGESLKFHALAEEPSPPAGEVRTTSSTGGQKGVKAEQYSLVPVEPLASLARLYAFGVRKYAAHNWRLGYEWSKSYDSLFRHASASLNGEDYDPETGEPHLAGVVFHAFALMEYLFHPEKYAQFDDRYKTPEIEEKEDGHPPILPVTIEIPEPTPEKIASRTLHAMGYDDMELLRQEYEGRVPTPIEEMIDFLAGMYDGWSVEVARVLRRVANDMRSDKNRNLKSFDEFREKFTIDNVTGTRKMLFVNHDTEIEPVQPKIDTRNMMVTIPTVVGAVYYYNDKHVVGSFQVRSTSEIKAVALPGYRFASGMDAEWTYLA